jgi:hypothetical protein
MNDEENYSYADAYWQADCVHRWNRWGPERTMEPDNPALPTAIVEIAPEYAAQLPGFANKWVWTCWCEPECGAWIGPFDTALEAIAACNRHFASGHTKLFWGDGEVTDVEPLAPEDELPDPTDTASS